MWNDETKNESKKVKVAVDIKPEGSGPPVNYTLATGHLILDVRMKLEQKARWVKDGHKTSIL